MENKLAVILKESQLEPTKAQYILEQFQDYFAIAAEWEAKARAIVVTNETQKAEMEMARTGRLFLREKRIAVEKARKKLKEQALREGKAIDGIANVLKALIAPIEEYLDKQEHFVELKQEATREQARIDEEKRLEEEEIAKQKAKDEEDERIRKENEKLKIEAEVREKRLAEERRLHDESIAKERAKADAEKKVMDDRVARERKAAEEKAQKEREAREKKQAEEKAKVEAEKKKAEEKAKKEKEALEEKAEAERKAKERLAEQLRNQVVCPKCGHKFQRKEGKK